MAEELKAAAVEQGFQKVAPFARELFVGVVEARTGWRATLPETTTPQGPAVQGQKIARPLAESRASRLQDAGFEEGYCPTGTTVLDHNKLVQSAEDCVPSETAK
jgi:hypothetical protein